MHDLMSFITYEIHTEPKYPYRAVAVILFYSTAICLTFLSALVAKTIPIPVQAKAPPRVIIASAVSTPPTKTQSPTPTTTPSPTPQSIVSGTPNVQALAQEKESIRQYINTIFTRNAQIAFAIALAEGGFTYKGVRYFRPAAVHHSDVETSIGIFQVNIQSKDAKVHYDQIPGKDLEEKIEWLQDPYNSVIFAYWMYSTHNNFEAWSVFTDGTYLAYVKQ